MAVYQKELWICATAYIRAENEREAMTKFRSMQDYVMQVPSGTHLEVEISEMQYDDEELPEISLSPVMTVYTDEEHCGNDFPEWTAAEFGEDEEAEPE